MGLSDSPLHLFAAVACDVSEKERQIREIGVQKLFKNVLITSESEKALPITDDGELELDKQGALLLLRISCRAQFSNPFGFIPKKQRSVRNKLKTIEAEAVCGMDSKKSMKRRLCPEIEKENKQIKAEIASYFSAKSSTAMDQCEKARPNSEANLGLQKQGVLMGLLRKEEQETMFQMEELGAGFKNPFGFIPRKKSPRRDSTINPSEKSRKRKLCPKIEGSNPPKKHRNSTFQPELPEEFRTNIQELEGSEVKLVIQKQMRTTDLNPNHSRFSIPRNQMQEEFLEEYEMELLDEHEENRRRLCGLNVLVLDPCLRPFDLFLKKWKMNTTITYNLTHGWNRLVLNNDLKSKDMVQLWSFRRNKQLCFALVKL